MSDLDPSSTRLHAAEPECHAGRRWQPAGAPPGRDDGTALFPLPIRVSAAWPRGGHGSRGR